MLLTMCAGPVLPSAGDEWGPGLQRKHLVSWLPKQCFLTVANGA